MAPLQLRRVINPLESLTTALVLFSRQLPASCSSAYQIPPLMSSAVVSSLLIPMAMARALSRPIIEPLSCIMAPHAVPSLRDEKIKSPSSCPAWRVRMVQVDR